MLLIVTYNKNLYISIVYYLLVLLIVGNQLETSYNHEFLMLTLRNVYINDYGGIRIDLAMK